MAGFVCWNTDSASPDCRASLKHPFATHVRETFRRQTRTVFFFRQLTQLKKTLLRRGTRLFRGSPGWLVMVIAP